MHNEVPLRKAHRWDALTLKMGSYFMSKYVKKKQNSCAGMT